MKKLIILVWLIIGMIFSSTVAIAHLSHANILEDNFYNTKKIQDSSESDFKNNTEIQDGEWNVTDDKFVAYMYFGKFGVKWNYVCIDVEELNRDNLTAYINYYNTENNYELLYTQQINLVQGNNVIKAEYKKFNFIGVFILEEPGAYLKVNAVQVRQTKPIQNFENRFGKRFVVFLCLYVLLSLLFYPVVKRIPFVKGIDCLIEWLLCLFQKLNNLFFIVVKDVPLVCKRGIRVVIMLITLLYFNATSVELIVKHTSKERAGILSCALLLIALTLVDKQTSQQDWKKPLVRTWFLYGALTIVSDLFVSKSIMYIGWILIFVFGFLIYCWNNQLDKEIFIRDIMLAVHIYFILVVLTCFVTRPDLYIRYQGTFSNPVTFGAYVSMIAALMLSEVSYCISQNKAIKRIFFHVIEFLLALFFVWKTQARSAILPIVVMLIIFIAKYVVQAQRGMNRKKSCYVTIMMMICAVPIFSISEYAINKIPVQLGTVITLENDGYQPDDPSVLKDSNLKIDSLFIQKVHAAENENRIWNKLTATSLEEITSGRSLYWKEYIRRMNLLGHNGYAKIMGKAQHPHCSLFLVAYRYGVYAVVPYLLMLIFTFAEGMRYLVRDVKKKTIGYANFPLAVIVVFLSISLFDVAEYLFSGFGWFLFNMVIGLLFPVNQEEG